MARIDINKILRGECRPARYGAPMGARSFHEGNDTPLYVQRVRFSDGCYAPDGTYWGAPANLYCAFDTDGTARLYARAPSRAAAIVELRKDWVFNVHREPRT